MITLERIGDVIKFTFQDNPLYLNNGTIEVPVNSLSLLIDESNIATFKKAASNDIFLSCSLDELGMTRTQLINWYKDNMVDEGITPEEVEDIVESATTNLFGYAEYDSQNTRINFKHDASGSVISSIDASDFVIDGMIDNVEIVTVEGVKYLKITFNTESGKEPILIPLADIFNPDNYYTKTATDALLAAKADTATTYTKTEVDNVISAATSGKADADDVYTKTEVNNAISAATSGKVDTDVFDEKERAVSIALNDLEDRKLDASAYTPTDLSNYYTKSETDGEIEEAVSGKADTSAVTEVNNALTAHTANTDIHVTSTDKTNWNAKPNTVSLTQAQYDALTVKDPNTFYVITDAEGVDLDNYYTKSETDSVLSGKADTTAVTQAISAATSGKADTSAVTEAISAAVSGKADSNNVYTKTEANALLADKLNTSAITTSMTSGSTDSQVPSAKAVYDNFGGLKLVKLTQAQYNALAVKDPMTLYVIADDVVCAPESDTWVTVDDNFVSYNKPVYNLSISGVTVSEEYTIADDPNHLINIFLYSEPYSGQNYDYVVNVEFNNAAGEESYELTIQNAASVLVYRTTDDTENIDLCQILGGGFYLNGIAPEFTYCTSVECTEYECLEYDEETGECIQEGECIMDECTNEETVYPLQVKQ